MTDPDRQNAAVDRNPKARRTYRLLGVVHALLFGGVLGSRTFIEAGPLPGIAVAVVFGGAFLGVFWKLANDHYRGDVPGKAGKLVYRGEANE